MTKFHLVLSLAFLACGAGPALHAQCSSSVSGYATINSAFQLALNRQPTQTECNPNRYAGGAYSGTTDLIPLVKASVVCSDPWIAQAYYQLGLKLNGHDPTQLDPTGPNSTTNNCNYAVYGSWSSFPQLKTLVTQYYNSGRAISPVQPTPAPAPVLAKVTITNPATLAVGASNTVTWTNGPAVSACASGFALQASGGSFGSNYRLATTMSLASGSFTFPFAASLPSSQSITLHFMDLCHSAVVSNEFSTMATATVVASRLDSQGCLIDASGQRLSSTESCGMYVISSAGIFAPGPYRIALNQLSLAPAVTSSASGLLLAGNGAPAMIQIPSPGTWRIVAGGGGNIVAAGGGNIVAAGGGNIVAAGGGNIILNGGGNLQFLDPLSAARATGLVTQTGASVISNDGGSLLPAISTLPNIAKFVGQNGSSAVPPTLPTYTVASVSSASTATITGPSVWTYGQPASVTWRLNQNTSCPSGVHVTVNNTIPPGSANVMLTVGRSVIPWTNLARGATVTLSLACGATPYSAPVSVRVQ